MAEVVPISGIDYDNDRDPLVRRLMFLRQSPSNSHNCLYRLAVNQEYTREQVEQKFRRLAILDSWDKNMPGYSGYIHHQWLQTLDPMDIMTNNPNIETVTRQVAPAPEITEVRDQSHGNLLRLPTQPAQSEADMTEFDDTPDENNFYFFPNVIPFPGFPPSIEELYMETIEADIQEASSPPLDVSQRDHLQQLESMSQKFRQFFQQLLTRLIG